MEQSAIERLAAKSPEETIIDQICRDFNLAPFMARTYFEQMQRYFERYPNLERDIGQMTFLALSATNPPGCAVANCERLAIALTIDHVDDLLTLGQGLAALRWSKIQRLTHEAQDQGALLTQENLARLLCTSRSTVKRDIAHLRAGRMSPGPSQGYWPRREPQNPHRGGLASRLHLQPDQASALAYGGFHRALLLPSWTPWRD